VGDIAIEDLVYQVQISLVADLFDIAPERNLVLFFRHALFSFRFSDGQYLLGAFFLS
jgi:hypothetical protein